MKKLPILAALILAALTMRAQAPADSVSVMLRNLQQTNAKLLEMNKGYNTHAVMVTAGGALVAVGSLVAISREVPPYGGEPMMSEARMRRGARIVAAGGLVIAASFVTLPKRVHLDNRGLVVDLE